MDQSHARGWCVVDKDLSIQVDTTCSTRRMAIVNFLVSCRGVQVMQSHSDEWIEAAWERLRGPFSLREVSINVLQ